jgi:osmoprotectant transport system substrate-binding protein
MRNPTRWAPMVAAMVLVTACGGGGGGVGGGGEAGPLDGAEFTVGSKEFPEQLILGHIAIKALENAGATVTDQLGIEGTANVRTALTSNKIQMYWEYTGTGWSTLLKHEVTEAPKDTQQLYQKVAQEDLQKNKIVWLSPAPMNNTYAIATAPGKGTQLGVRTLTDYARLANSNPQQASLCAANEFLTRDDGLPGLEKTYGFKLPKTSVSEMDLAVIHTRIPKSQPCNFGEVFATDGEIVANRLEVVQDDKGAFVKYNLAMTVRQDAYDKHKQALNAVFDPITKLLTDDVMRQLNAKVSKQGLDEEEVAEQFLKDNKLIK